MCPGRVSLCLRTLVRSPCACRSFGGIVSWDKSLCIGPPMTSQTPASPTRLLTGLGSRPQSSAGRPPENLFFLHVFGFLGAEVCVQGPADAARSSGGPVTLSAPALCQVLRAAPVGV